MCDGAAKESKKKKLDGTAKNSRKIILVLQLVRANKVNSGKNDITTHLSA